MEVTHEKKKGPVSKRARPRPASPRQASTVVHLVFDQRVANPDVGYFALHEDYERVAAIERALNTAKTWGELRALMPPGEFQELLNWYSNDGEKVYREGATHFFGPPGYPEDDDDDFDYLSVIDSNDAFSATDVTGVDSGDYPPFLEADQERFLPRDFCMQFGTAVSGFTSGGWYEFPLDRFEEMRAWLEARGFAVTDRRARVA